MDNILDFIRTISMTIGTGATVIGGYFVYQNLLVNQRKLLTDRFSDAVKLFGTEDNRTVRLAGIYALSNIAKDSPEYHWLVMKVIASFIRNRDLEYPPLGDINREGYPRVYSEIQEAITVIAQRNFKYDVSGETLNLSNSSFFRANLTGANFRKVNLRDANFCRTDLKGVDFSGANLEKANFLEADLSGAILKEANLKNATTYSNKTKFPSNFDPVEAGMKKNG